MKKNITKTSQFIFTSSLLFSVILGLTFYNSTNGTDFNRYYRYIEYFLGNAEYTSREQGVFYFWTVYKVAEMGSLVANIPDLQSLINISIQISNIIYYLFGTLGFFKLLKFYKFQSNDIYMVLAFLNLFPPIFGARLIMKPEILAFSILPWILYLLETYLESKQLLKLIYLIPLIVLGFTAKAFITASLSLLLILKFLPKIKEFDVMHLIYFFIPSLFLCLLIFYNDYKINNVGFLYHELVEQYNYKAAFSLIYNFDINQLIHNPFRDNMRNSFFGITLIDLFGDYFERYWDHSRSLFFENRIESSNYNLNLIRRYVAIVISLIFIFLSMFASRGKSFKLYSRSYFLGIFLILLTAYGFFGTYFNPGKGDTLKTHYYSHLLALSFVFILIDLIKRGSSVFNYSVFAIYFLIIIFIFGFPWSFNIDLKNVVSSQLSHFNNLLI
jgi:hypothetical protein